MNVSLESIDKVSAQLIVKVEKADYQEKVDKSLKEQSANARFPQRDGACRIGKENVWQVGID